MAVTIDEMHVEVQAPKAAASGPAPNGEPPKDVDLREAMEVLYTRNLRLRAD